jgi:hypothetical protein
MLIIHELCVSSLFHLLWLRDLDLGTSIATAVYTYLIVRGEKVYAFLSSSWWCWFDPWCCFKSDVTFFGGAIWPKFVSAQ